jgi:DNA-binding LacI/PurR family transcriptional regulator
MKSEAIVPSQSDHKLVTIRDVARLAGVSPITASRALNKSYLVKPETRKKVEAAAAELKFIGNSAAGSLSNKRSNMVGIIVPTLSNSIKIHARKYRK